MTTAPIFGQPSEAPAPPAPEPPAPKSSRTALIVVGAGVAALAILGGAAALVLTSGGDDVVAGPLEPGTLPTAEASLAPDAAASGEPVAPATPLPTSAVQGRNIFVPLVAESVESSEVAADPGTPVDAPATSGSTGTSGQSGSNQGSGGSGLTYDADAATTQALQAALGEIASLESQIASLQQQLAVESDDAALEQQLAALQQDYDNLAREAEELANEVDKVVVVNFTELDALTVPAQTLTVLVNGEPRVLDLDPATADVSDRTVIGTTEGGFDVVLTYQAVNESGIPPQTTVRVQVASSTYTVSVGASLAFSLG